MRDKMTLGVRMGTQTRNDLIKLKEARELAQEILDDDQDLPKVGSLPKWKERGLIMGPEIGNLGLYPKSLPIQIAIVAELLSEGIEGSKIAQVTSEIFPKIREQDTTELTEVPKILDKFLMCFFDVDEIFEDYKEADKKWKEAESQAEREKWLDQKQEAVERLKLQDLFIRYIDAWDKYRKRLVAEDFQKDD